MPPSSFHWRSEPSDSTFNNVKHIPKIPLAIVLLLVLSGGGIALRAAKPSPTPTPDVASVVKVTLKPLGGGVPVSSSVPAVAVPTVAKPAPAATPTPLK